jgi:hypothetical protein
MVGDGDASIPNKLTTNQTNELNEMTSKGQKRTTAMMAQSGR